MNRECFDSGGNLTLVTQTIQSIPRTDISRYVSAVRDVPAVQISAVAYCNAPSDE